MRIKIRIRQIRQIDQMCWIRRIRQVRRVRWIRRVRQVRRIYQIRGFKITMLKVCRFKEIKSFVSKKKFLKVTT